jgi:hypothetical protein
MYWELLDATTVSVNIQYRYFAFKHRPPFSGNSEPRHKKTRLTSLR